MNAHKDNPVKKFFLKWVWRVQQIGSISTLIITAFTLTLAISDKIEWRVANTYLSVLLTFGLLASIIMCLGWFWDKKLQMWKEQNVVNVERNPYYMFKMTPKEIVSYQTWWFPWMRQQGGEVAKRADVWEKWVNAQLEGDAQLKKSVEEMNRWLEHL